MKKIDIKKWLKDIIITAIIIFIMANLISFLRKPDDLQNKTMPQFQTTLVDGKRFSTDALKDRAFILHFWATWCPTCKLEISNFNALSKEYEVITVAVNSGSDSEIKAFLEKRGLRIKVINDQSGKLANYFGVEAFPTTFILDKSGKVVAAEVGYTSTLKLKLRLWLLSRE